MIPPFTKKLRPAHYAHGHNPDGFATRFAVGHRESAETKAKRIKRGREHWRWSGGEWKLRSGYVRVTLTTKEAAKHPTARRHRGESWSLPRSHLIWNKAHLNAPVLPGEHVHHRNHVRDDDRPENLEKLQAAEHLRKHRAMDVRERDSTGRFI